jgi:hypothetical protein
MNRLDAVVFAVTSNEITNKSFERCCYNIVSSEYIGLDLVIFVNNSKFSKNDILFLNRLTFFRTVIIINLNIQDVDDVYIINPKRGMPIPKYGFISGPNITFFRIIQYCKKYNTILLLECDTILKENAIKKSIEYVSNNDFLISGSKYLGKLKTDNEIFRNHINGVAFYKTGSDEFQTLINNVKNTILNEYIKTTPSIAYDVAIFMYIHITMKSIDEKHSEWRNLILPRYKTCELILNYSPKPDRHTSVDDITKKYPNHVILHKKLNI